MLTCVPAPAESPAAPGKPLPTHSHKYVLLFLKYYDARAKQLRYVMQTVLHRSNKLEEVLEQVRRSMSLFPFTNADVVFVQVQRESHSLQTDLTPCISCDLILRT